MNILNNNLFGPESYLNDTRFLLYTKYLKQGINISSPSAINITIKPEYYKNKFIPFSYNLLYRVNSTQFLFTTSPFSSKNNNVNYLNNNTLKLITNCKNTPLLKVFFLFFKWLRLLNETTLHRRIKLHLKDFFKNLTSIFYHINSRYFSVAQLHYLKFKVLILFQKIPTIFYYKWYYIFLFLITNIKLSYTFIFHSKKLQQLLLDLKLLLEGKDFKLKYEKVQNNLYINFDLMKNYWKFLFSKMKLRSLNTIKSLVTWNTSYFFTSKLLTQFGILHAKFDLNFCKPKFLPINLLNNKFNYPFLIKNTQNIIKTYIFLKKSHRNFFITLTDSSGRVKASWSFGKLHIKTVKQKRTWDSFDKLCKELCLFCTNNFISLIQTLVLKTENTKLQGSFMRWWKILLFNLYSNHIMVNNVRITYLDPHGFPRRKKTYKRL